MKKITKLFIPIIIFVITFASLETVIAQRPASESPQVREDARTIIHRTKVVIAGGQQAVAHGHVYTGDLAKAISHQHLAVKLFNQGLFVRAINQSIRARQIVFNIIIANKNVIKPEWNLTEMEKSYVRASSPPAQLDREVVNAKIDVDLKDEKAATTNYSDLDLDIDVR